MWCTLSVLQLLQGYPDEEQAYIASQGETILHLLVHTYTVPLSLCCCGVCVRSHGADCGAVLADGLGAAVAYYSHVDSLCGGRQGQCWLPALSVNCLPAHCGSGVILYHFTVSNLYIITSVPVLSHILPRTVIITLCIHTVYIYTPPHCHYHTVYSHCHYHTVYLQEKCEQYWPDQLNTTVNKGSKFTVTLTSYVPSAEYQIRKLQLKSVRLYTNHFNEHYEFKCSCDNVYFTKH